MDENLKTKQVGQTLIEAALLVAVLVPLVLMVFQVTYHSMAKQIIKHALAEAARTANLTGNPKLTHEIIVQNTRSLNGSIDLKMFLVDATGTELKQISWEAPGLWLKVDPLKQNSSVQATGVKFVLDYNLPVDILSVLLRGNLASVHESSSVPFGCVPDPGKLFCS